MHNQPCFDHEKLDVYRLAVEFLGWTGELLDGPLAKVRCAAAKHLDEASPSIANNIAEGNGKRSSGRPFSLSGHRTWIGPRVRCLFGWPGREAKDRLRTSRSRKGYAASNCLDAYEIDRTPPGLGTTRQRCVEHEHEHEYEHERKMRGCFSHQRTAQA